jgi:hypothetical protein
MDCLAYNPFPLEEDLIMRDGGIVRFGVGLDIADEVDWNTRTFDCVTIFFKRWGK